MHALQCAIFAAHVLEDCVLKISAHKSGLANFYFEPDIMDQMPLQLVVPTLASVWDCGRCCCSKCFLLGNASK